MKPLLRISLISLFLPGLLLGFSRIRTSGGAPLRLASSSVQFTVSSGIGSAPNILPGGDPLAALNAARQEWNQFSTSTLVFQPFGPVSDKTRAENDGVNLITFSDASVFGASNTDTLAITVILFSNATGLVVDTDVVFNPNVKFFITPGSEGFDLQSVATHEFGHAITADHTAVQSATMFQSSSELQIFQRTLDSDDIAFIASTYPSARHPFGSISGRVLSGGEPVFGAHVVGYDASRNIFISGVSLRDGSYSIDSIPPGSYAVYAEPFDGPVTVESLLSGNVNSFFGGANTKFITTIGSPQSVVAGQQAQNADILAPSGSATLNVTGAGRNFVPPANSAGSFLIGSGPVLASPGQSFTLVVTGDGITADSVRAPDFRLDIEGAGFRITGQGNGAFQGGSTFGFVNVSIADNAVPGPRQVKVSVGGQTSYYTAGLVIAERGVPQSTQRLAAVQQNAAQFTGIGVTNLSDTPTVVRALFFNPSGQLFAIPGMQNPAYFSVPSKGQVARVSQDVFQAVRQENGWVELQADQSQVYAFFLTGDSSGARLNGSDVPRSGLTGGIFTDVRQNAIFQTEIHMANGNGVPATVSFQFFGIVGGQRAGPVTRVLGPRASLSETAQELFAGLIADGGYITFSSDQPVSALELVRSTTSLVSLNAQDLSTGSTTIVSPHFAVGNAGLVFFSRLHVVNPGTAPVSAQIEARDSRGTLLRALPVTMAAQEILQLGVAETFGIAPAGPPVIGSITLRSVGGPIFGSILFGDAIAGNFASEFPLETTAGLANDLVFEQLATAAGFYTGIAVYNPSATTSARITVEVRTPDATQLGNVFQRTLAPNEKLTNQITELVGPSVNQAGGYIRVRSDQPVSAIVLFGNSAGTALAAVPASKVQ